MLMVEPLNVTVILRQKASQQKPVVRRVNDYYTALAFLRV